MQWKVRMQMYCIESTRWHLCLWTSFPKCQLKEGEEEDEEEEEEEEEKGEKEEETEEEPEEEVEEAEVRRGRGGGEDWYSSQSAILVDLGFCETINLRPSSGLNPLQPAAASTNENDMARERERERETKN